MISKLLHLFYLHFIQFPNLFGIIVITQLKGTEPKNATTQSAVNTCMFYIFTRQFIWLDIWCF